MRKRLNDDKKLKEKKARNCRERKKSKEGIYTAGSEGVVKEGNILQKVK